MDRETEELVQERPTTLAELRRPLMQKNSPQADSEDDACMGFGFLRGVRDRAISLELRFENGHRLAYSYGLLAESQYNPSAGIMLKFLGEIVHLVVIQGSNLNSAVNGISLYERGLLRHRVTFIQEMTREQLKAAGEGEATIDRIFTVSYRQDEAPKQVDWLEPFRLKVSGAN